MFCHTPNGMADAAFYLSMTPFAFYIPYDL